MAKRYDKEREKLKRLLTEHDGEVTGTGIDLGQFFRWQLKRLRRGRSHQKKRYA
jgi:hypothetical protein